MIDLSNIVLAGFEVFILTTHLSSGLFICSLNSTLATATYCVIHKMYCQDDSREVASRLFPSMSSQLKRKKDHGSCTDFFFILLCYLVLGWAVEFIAIIRVFFLFCSIFNHHKSRLPTNIYNWRTLNPFPTTFDPLSSGILDSWVTSIFFRFHDNILSD